eukprot:CAMPEP_0172783964 /NCGR_PEP_ID=MMETSP1074-20121228/204703_1 /TAXON_ID=2916 /ORGANISM="Ceratium fusus, Strain PA161109" /LENGTH=870 /DNA_ID=CAMNT_0013620963 /DNA_START=66 /DNA_END=2677 /DNA_ORIENTATION=+
MTLRQRIYRIFHPRIQWCSCICPQGPEFAEALNVNSTQIQQDTTVGWEGELKLLEETIKRNRKLEDELLNQLRNVSLHRDGDEIVFSQANSADGQIENRRVDDQCARQRKLLNILQRAKFVFRLHERRLLPSNIYFGVFWFRFPFMFLMSMLLTTSAFLGALMQVMFCVCDDIYDEPYTSDMKEFIAFSLLPLLICLCSFLVHKLWDLIFSSFSPPYFVDFRARLLTIYALKWNTRYAPSARSCLKMDLYFFLGFEVLPLLGLVYNAFLLNVDGALEKYPHFFYLGHLGKGDTMWGGYITGMLYNIAFMVFLDIVVEVVYCELERRRTPERSLSIILEKITDVIETHRIHPMSMGHNSLAFESMLDFRDLEHQTNQGERQHDDQDDEQDEHEDHHQDRHLQNSDSRDLEHQINQGEHQHDEQDEGQDEHQGDHQDRHPQNNEDHARLRYKSRFRWVPWMVMVLWWQADSALKLLQSADNSWLAALPWFFTALSLLLAITCISEKFENLFPLLKGTTFGSSIVLFCLIQALLFLNGFHYHQYHVDSTRPLKPIMVVNGSCNGTLNCSWPDPGEVQRYPVCGQCWGNSDSAVTALDLAALSWIVYEQSESDIKRLLSETFGPGPRLENFTNYYKTPRWIAVRFPPGWKHQATSGTARKEGADTLVVAVKGTSTIKDAFLDTDLFTTIKVLQYFEFFAPVLKVMSVDFVQWIMKTVKLWAGDEGSKEMMIWDRLEKHMVELQGAERTPWAGDEGSKEMMIWDRLEKHMVELQGAERTRNTNTKFVLTGHSLGGTIAEIVAAKQCIPALVWSAPGTLYSQAYFSGNHTGSVSEERMQRNAVVVVPDNDAVPRVDSQQSVVQRIQCFRKHHMPVD